MDSTRPPTILVIDDIPSLRESLRRTLRNKGYVVMEASEGDEGIDVIRNHYIDIVLVDLFMSGKEGLWTILELRRSHPKVWIIAMSGRGARGQVDMLEVAKVMGRCQTLAKPFPREELLKAVDCALCALT